MFSGARQPQHARTAVRLLPREEEFFDLFVEVATRSTVAAQHLRELFDAPPDRRIAHVEAIKRLEHEADQVTHEVVNRLDRTFITPLDREDIHQLASDLDDVMDAIYQEALGRMFETERDALEIIKWKEIYDNLETTLDQGEDVANVLESITIKHA